MMQRGISIQSTIGLGDKIQFTSLPENYYRATGEKLVDHSQSWVFDHNPYVQRHVRLDPIQVTELWNHDPVGKPRPRASVFLSNAERHASWFKVPVVMNRPRLYFNEGFPYQERQMILFQVEGVSHGKLPDPVIDHVLSKYKDSLIFQIGLNNLHLGIPYLSTPDEWSLVERISECKMFIGPDSGPSWVAACYPDVIVKKVRTKPQLDRLEKWIPLEIDNIHAHWDDRRFQIYNTTEHDVGFTWSYKQL